MGIEKQSVLSNLIGAGISSLDISPAEYAQVESRYKALGRTLDDYWADSPLDNLAYPQGSFALGTVTRRIHQNDDVDIDLVVVRGLSRASTTQAELKSDTGSGLRRFQRSTGSGEPILSESDRCWTLEYPSMHIDVLPAIPDDFYGTKIAITDKNVSRWQPSDPKAYATWFHGLARGEREAREKNLVTAGVDVADVPRWRRKTNLQLSVQALKRHRDIFFADDLGRRPSSIVVTTLAAVAYDSNRVAAADDLVDALRAISTNLLNGLDRIDGVWLIRNPAMRDENFADYWHVDKWRPAALFEWIEALQRDLATMPSGQGADAVLDKVGRLLGQNAKFASARALSDPIRNARKAGSLTTSGGSGMLAVGPTVAGSRFIPNHSFHGGRRPV